ncbi:MAG TPA: response regulator [Pyrinomonadaceae bacterium]|jgi:CheY-like chemotaxis protein|nr:response regulator [Pyrinomonadaceae bacterium]
MTESSTKTILLVEDYKDSREMFSLLLEGHGYRILGAQNGKEAIDLAEAQTPDLVLTDFNLPDIDGTTLIKRLRKLGGMNHIPIIMVTAHPPGELSKLAMAAGCTTFLTKPISFSILENTIARLLQDSREFNGSVNEVSH